MNRLHSRCSLTIALMSAAGSAAAATALLPIDAGTYVVSSYSPCEEAPLAGVVAYDGKAFAGPHESACRSVVLGHDGSSYRVRTTCRAAGDGTADRPSTFLTGVDVESRTTFVLKHDGAVSEYRLCPAFH